MRQPVPIQLALRSNPARNRQGGNTKLINCYAEEQEQDGKVTWIIYGTEGLENFGSALSGGGVRKKLVVGSTLYAVAGRNVYAVSTGGFATLLGSVPTDGPVYMVRNRKVPPQIGIVSDGLYYVIDTTSNTLSQVNDPDLPAPISISMIDGYGVLPVVNGSFFLTGQDELTTISASDEGTAEVYPDVIVRSEVLERELVMFGETSIEWFQNTGDTFPFTRVHALELGCLAGDSVAKVDTQSHKTIVWVAPDHTVRQMSGYAGQVISTNEIHELIKQLDLAGNASQLKGFAWAYGGILFYALVCNSWAKVYDSKTGQWHDRRSENRDRWRVNTVVKFGEKLVAGDYQTGQLYLMDTSYKSEAGDYLISEIIAPTVHAFPYRMKQSALYIDMATGVGLNSSDAHEYDPQLTIKWSDDGGHSYKTPRYRDMGVQGDRRRIQPIYRMGMFGQKGRTFSFSMSSPVDRVMLQISGAFEQLKA